MSAARRLRLLTVAAAWLLLAGAAPAAESTPLTIMPFQTATFVGDAAATDRMNTFAEFSARLLYWTDTPRGPAVRGGQVIKAALLPFVDEWYGRPGRGAAGESATNLSSEAFRALTGPRLARVTIGAEVTIGAPAAIDVLTGGANEGEIPWILENRRDTAVSVAIAAAEGANSLATVTLAAGETRGVFVTHPANADGRTIAGRVTVAGASRPFEFPFQRHVRGRLTLEVLDESGAVTPARIYLTASDRRAYAPANTMHRLVSGEAGQAFAGEPYFHTPGRSNVEVPTGAVEIEVVKGFEYRPVRRTVRIEPGTTATASIRLERVAQLQREGWYSGDVHVHANLFAQKLTTPRDALLAAEAEDLNVMNLLPCNDPRTATITDLQYFTGGPDPVSTPTHILYFNEEMRNDIYGHVGFLNLKKFVEPAYFGWPHSPFPYDVPGNFPQAAQARAQGGVVTYVHPALPSEFPVDIALGVADTVDVMNQNAEDVSTAFWYRLLNCGFRCPVSAGTDSFLNIPVHLIPGAGRVYVKVNGAFNYERWIEGFRAGRSFASNGPLLRFTVNGLEAGGELNTDGPVEVAVAAAASSIVPMEALELVVNGQTVRRWPVGSDPLHLDVAEKIRIERSSWIALRVRGSAHRLAPNDREVYAHTSPVYVTVAGRKVASHEDARFFIEQIDALISRMDGRGKFERPEQRDVIVAKFREAQEVYRRIAASAPSP
jgi:TolB protein